MEDMNLIPEDRKLFAVVQPWHINVLIVAKRRNLIGLFTELVARYGGFSRNGGVTKSVRDMAKECGFSNPSKFSTKLQVLRTLGLISYGNRKTSMQAGTILFINTDTPHQFASELPVIVRAEKPVESIEEPTTEHKEANIAPLVTQEEEIVQEAIAIVAEEAKAIENHEQRLADFYRMAAKKAAEEVYPPETSASQTIEAIKLVEKYLNTEESSLSKAVTALYSVKYSEYGLTEKSFKIGLQDTETIPYERLEAWQRNNYTMLELRNQPSRERAEKERAERQAKLDAERANPRPFVLPVKEEPREIDFSDLLGAINED